MPPHLSVELERAATVEGPLQPFFMSLGVETIQSHKHAVERAPLPVFALDRARENL